MKTIRRKVVSARKGGDWHRTWQLKLECGHERQVVLNLREVPKTSRCTKCERPAQGEAHE